MIILYKLTSSFAVVNPLVSRGFAAIGVGASRKFVSTNSFLGQEEASNKISARLVQPCRRVIVTLPDKFSAQ